MQIFDPNNTFFRWVAWVTDVLGLSLLWAFASLPIITAGAATTALYDSVLHCVKPREAGAFRRFFETFRASFKTTALSSLCWGLLWAGLLLGARVLVLMALAGYRAALLQLVVFCVLLVIPAGVVCWQFPLWARRPMGFAQLNLSAARLTLARLPATLLTVAATLGGLWLCWRYWLPIFFMPVLWAFLCSIWMEPIFDKDGFLPLEEDC